MLTLQQIEKLFEEKFPEFKGVGSAFPIFAENPNREHIKQFWLEHIRALLESVKLETKKINPCDNCYNKDQMADKRCMNCQYDAGWNLRNLLLNTKIKFLLSEGKEEEV